MCKCARCSVKIDINEVYFSKRDENELSMNYYCPDCWEFMNTPKWSYPSKEEK